MKILHIVTAFPRREGDPITPWLVRLLEHQRVRGHEPEVLTSAYRGLSGGTWGTRPGVRVHRFRYAPAAWETLTHEETVPDRVRTSFRHAALVPLYLAAGTKAAFRLGRRRPDVIHVHWPLPHALFGVTARRGSSGSSALVCSFYSVEIRWTEHRMRWLRPMLRWSARVADGVTAISTETARRVRQWLPDRPVKVIPFAGAIDEPADNTDVPHRVPLSGDELEILFVGRLVERKGVEVLVRALPRVLLRRRARLTIVGAGEWEGRIREVVRSCGVEDRVEFTGFVPEAELRRRFGSCDVFVLPAVVDAKGDTEGLGVVLLEALRFGRPVVASAVGGIPDIVEHGRTGWLVPPGDPDALADTLLGLAERPEEAKAVAEEGRRITGQRFAWDRILNDLDEVYEAAIRARRGS